MFGQDKKLPELILSSLKIYEPNPIHLKEIESINNRFKSLIIDSKDNFGTNIMEQFDNLYKIGLSEFEDNTDMLRIKMEQCIYLASIAVLSDRDRFVFFIDLAKHCITDSTGKSIEFLEIQNCGLILLKIYLKSNFKIDFQTDLVDLDKALELYKSSMVIDFYNDSKMIIKKYKK